MNVIYCLMAFDQVVVDCFNLEQMAPSLALNQ